MSKFKSIGIVLYEDFNTLDVAGPLQVFYWLSYFLKNDIKIYLIGPEKNGQVKSRENVIWVSDTSYEGAPKDLDILVVPGGGGPGFDSIVENKGDKYHRVYNLLESRAPKAKLVCSVCVGALILAKAGLLKGYLCTTHWAAITQLAQSPGVVLAPGYPRYIIDRNRITGGGVSSGIDEALIIAEIVGGEAIARQVQLIIQYAPNPPYNSGDPSVASATTIYNTMKAL